MGLESLKKSLSDIDSVIHLSHNQPRSITALVIVLGLTACKYSFNILRFSVNPGTSQQVRLVTFVIISHSIFRVKKYFLIFPSNFPRTDSGRSDADCNI